MKVSHKEVGNPLVWSRKSFILSFLMALALGSIGTPVLLYLHLNGMDMDKMFQSVKEAYTSSKTDTVVYLGGFVANLSLNYMLMFIVYKSRVTLCKLFASFAAVDGLRPEAYYQVSD